MEWVKARTLRSTWWISALTLAGTIGLAIVVLRYYPSHWSHLSRAQRASFDPVNDGFTGLALAQLLMAAFGVLAITSEYSGGMIRSTLAAMPRRPADAGRQGRRDRRDRPDRRRDRGLRGVLRRAVGADQPGAARHAGPAAGGAGGAAGRGLPGPDGGDRGGHRGDRAPLGGRGGGDRRADLRAAADHAGLPDSVQHSVQRFLPEIIAENSLTVIKPVAYSLSAWAGLAMLCAYAAVLLVAGGWLLARRDA